MCRVATPEYKKCIQNFIHKPDGKMPLIRLLELYYKEPQGCYYFSWCPTTKNNGKGKDFVLILGLPERHLFSMRIGPHLFIYLFGWLVS